MLEIRPVPPALVDAQGRVVEGIFDAACPCANLEQARPRIAGLPLPAPLARLRLKQWQHWGLILPDAFLGLAIVDTGWMRASWCHLRDRSTGLAVEHARRSPLLDLRVATDLWDDACWVRARGYEIEIENQLGAGQHLLAVAVEEDGGREAIHASLRCRQELARNQPLCVCMPVTAGCYMYSHKAVLPLEGELSLGGRSLAVEPGRSFAIVDVHKAYYPWHTFWKWATFAGCDRTGRWIGLNLTKNPNRDEARINENALWVDGAIRHLGPARFEHRKADGLAPWSVGTEDGTVDLTFRPEGCRQEDLRLGLLRSVFYQLQGTFDGSVRFDSEVIPVEGLYGLCEDHDSLW